VLLVVMVAWARMVVMVVMAQTQPAEVLKVPWARPAVLAVLAALARPADWLGLQVLLLLAE